MGDDALREEVMARLLEFISGVVLHNTEVARGLGLGASDAQFVGLLTAHGPLTPGRLATMTGLTTGTVTGVIDRLERGGFVRRERDPTDRRKVLVTPREEGTARLIAQYTDYGAHTEAVLARRDADQLRVIAAFLAEMVEPPERSVSDAER